MRHFKDIVLKADEGNGISSIDSFTGLYNHNFFMVSLERELLRSRRNGRSFTLVLIGVDSGDVYYQNHGFLQENRIIKSLAIVIDNTIRRWVDIAAYLGEDVIALMLPNTDTQSAQKVIERIRSRFAAKNQNGFALSIGLSTCPSDGHEGDTLLQRAQRAMIEANRKGKNQMPFFENQVLSPTKPVPQI
jgi:diguanylate cyclase (GGDEF)-like protein